MAVAATEDRPSSMDRIPRLSNETMKRNGPLASGGQADRDYNHGCKVPDMVPKPDVAAKAAVRTADAEELAWIAEQSRRLEGRSPEEILAWAVERYFPRFTMATGLGPEGCVIISMLAKIEPRVYVFNLDTGYQFRETLELRDQDEREVRHEHRPATAGIERRGL